MGIGSPLSQRDALELSKVAHQAPFGKGIEKTVLAAHGRSLYRFEHCEVIIREGSIC